ncbi:palmitoyl-monogalactosyldiacylglycerol delta-7 desaturase [Forsythia ovata]|uniref:Palmitoyl-monogalactosyldiacylglycerol delta-7 desaturase n=1 Tax=Forsythia ovata TaxID=205694 RepID=A0ABD1UBT9_9LAMI
MVALLELPPTKVNPFSFSAHHRPNIKPAKSNFPTITHKHQESIYDARNIRIKQNNLNYGFKRKIGNGNSKIPATIPSPECGKDPSFREFCSYVVVKRRWNVYWGRKWNSLDVAIVGVVVAMHLLCLFALFTFNWELFGLLLDCV